MKNFKGKVVVITGAGSGIGRSTALAFAREGARLHIADIAKEKVEDVAREITGMGAFARAYAVDCSDKNSMARFADDVFRAEGRVDVLHNNAGVAFGGAVEKMPLEQWERIISVNLWGPIYGMHFFVPRMIAQGGGGHVVNTSSVAGLMAFPTVSAYSTTKFALVGLSEVMNIELARHGIHTTALCPGFINTPLVQATEMNIQDRKGRPVKDRIIRFYRDLGASPDRVAQDVLKAVRKKRPVQQSPWFHLGPVWILKRLSVRAYIQLMRAGNRLSGFR